MEVEQCYKCEFCTLKLENYHLWCQHLRELHNVVFVQCEYCNAQLPSKSELLKHVRSRHTDGRNPRVECSRCPSTFLSLKGLEKHISRKHNQAQSPTFTCKKCDKTYKNRSSLRSHQKTHLPLSYIKCDQCPRVFYNKQNLKTHKHVEHSANYQRAQCSLCPASYKYRTHLSRHMREKHFSDTLDSSLNEGSGNSEPDNKCNICYTNFPNKTTLLEHRKTFHNRCIDIFSCGQCTAVFKIREAYENHLQEEHGLDSEAECDVDNKNYIFQEYVDFETAMLQNFELRQLMTIRKSYKFSQKLIIVTYRQDSDDNGNNEPDDSELQEILPNISSFFETLVSHYRVDQMTEVKDLPVQICLNDPQIEENHSEVEHFEFDVPDASEPPILYNEEIKENDQFGAETIVNMSEEANKLTYDAIDEITQMETHNMMQIPKIMFNCLECTDLFPDEDNLWSHLTEVHKKTIKRPVTLKDYVQTEETPQTMDQRPANEKNIAAKITRRKRNDAQYIIKQNNKQFHEKVVLRNTNTKQHALKIKSKHNKKLKVKKIKVNVKTNKRNSAIKRRAKSNKELENMNKCNTCKKSFKLKALLVRHINYTHKNKKPKITNNNKNKDKLQLKSVEQMSKTEFTSNKKYINEKRQLRVRPKSENVLKMKSNIKNNKEKKLKILSESYLKKKEKHHIEMSKNKSESNKEISKNNSESIKEISKNSSECNKEISKNNSESNKQISKNNSESNKEISKKNSESKKEKTKLMYPCKYCHALFPCIELLVNHCSWQHIY